MVPSRGDLHTRGHASITTSPWHSAPVGLETYLLQGTWTCNGAGVRQPKADVACRSPGYLLGLQGSQQVSVIHLHKAHAARRQRLCAPLPLPVPVPCTALPVRQRPPAQGAHVCMTPPTKGIVAAPRLVRHCIPVRQRPPAQGAHVHQPDGQAPPAAASAPHRQLQRRCGRVALFLGLRGRSFIHVRRTHMLSVCALASERRGTTLDRSFGRFPFPPTPVSAPHAASTACRSTPMLRSVLARCRTCSKHNQN